MEGLLLDIYQAIISNALERATNENDNVQKLKNEIRDVVKLWIYPSSFSA